MVTEPLEWKSPKWWRNRPVEERLEFIRPPRRLKNSRLSCPPWTGEFVDNWELGDGLVITGRPGSPTGECALDIAVGLVKEKGASVRWIAAEQYIEMIKDSFDNDGLLPTEYSSPYTIKNVKGVFDVVVVDGLGDERLTEFAAHEMGSLIKTRWDRMLTTIVTTNLSLLDIKSRYGERLSVPLAAFETRKVS